MDKAELYEILAEHRKWLNYEGGQQANLSGARLRGTNLRGACLTSAILNNADLCGADLFGADLRFADLRNANLSIADLRCTNLADAGLTDAIDGAVCRIDFGGWSVCIRSTHTSIGCKRHPNEAWLGWYPSSPEIVAMHSNAPYWWSIHGEVVKAAIRCVMRKASYT